jgi:hypothetical protein
MSLCPLRRPLKRKLLAPGLPVCVKDPPSVTTRVHLRTLRLLWVRATHRAVWPWPCLRPKRSCLTVKRTIAAKM